MIQNLIFGILLLKILFLTQQLFYIHPHVLADIIKVFSEISKPTKIIDKDHLFCNTDSLKMPHSFENIRSLVIENKMLPKPSKSLYHFTNFSANMFLFGVRKIFALHHFLTPKNCILEAL